MIKFDVTNRFSGAVQFTAEIDCDENAPVSIKLGLAVKWAISARANLTDANVTGASLARADLAGANLAYANLTYAYLAYANLTGANLTDANLRAFKADLWMTLTQNRAEVPALIAALRDGRVDGSTYEGECACLVGTIANARHVPVQDLERDANNPAEKWFMAIRKGDKPGDATEGGFRSARALEWTLEWCALHGVEA